MFWINLIGCALGATGKLGCNGRNSRIKLFWRHSDLLVLRNLANHQHIAHLSLCSWAPVGTQVLFCFVETRKIEGQLHATTRKVLAESCQHSIQLEVYHCFRRGDGRFLCDCVENRQLQALALSFSTTNLNIKQAGGRRFRMSAITFDALYVNGTGWTVAASDVNLAAIEHATPINLRGYQLEPTISGTGVVYRAYKGNTEASTNEAGLSGLIGLAFLIGY